jgi:hypothetical protein
MLAAAASMRCSSLAVSGMDLTGTNRIPEFLLFFFPLRVPALRCAGHVTQPHLELNESVVRRHQFVFVAVDSLRAGLFPRLPPTCHHPSR